MNCAELELDVDAEHIMWMYHLKYFIELRRKYDTFIKFRGYRAFLEGPDMGRVRIAVESVKRRANQEFVYDFLMESDNPDESYAPYMDLLSNQEYEQIKRQYQGLYIFTKKQFMNIKSELSSRYGYVANFSKPYPLNYVIIWLPQNKQSFLSQRITTLVQVICKSLEQGVTPMNAQFFSYRNRDLAARNVFHKNLQIKVTDFQAIQIFMIFDIRKIEEHYQVSLSLQDGGNQVLLIIQGQSDYNCHSAMGTLENHLKNKVLLQMPLESKELLEVEKRVIQSSDIETHANRLDQLFGTDILKRITSNLNKSIFVFVEISEVNYLKSKIQNQSSQFTNSNLASDLVKKEIIQEQELSVCKQEQRQLRVIKDHKLLTVKDAVIIEFFNYSEGMKFYLFQNNFNDEEFQKDFDEYSSEHYTYPHLVSPDYSVPNQLKFKIEIFDTDQKKVIVQIKDFLEHYMNFKIILGVKNHSNVDVSELEELADDYNCKLSIKKCDLSNRQVGWIEEDEPVENSKGKDCIIILNNLIHCFVRQVKSKIEQLIKLQQQKIITLLFESQFDYAYNLACLKKLNIFSHFYLEDCYWVQIECKDPKSVLQNIRDNDMSVLTQVLEKMHIKQTESIILTQSSENYDCYDVFIRERSEEYYGKLRSDYLKYCLTEDEWKRVQLTPDESLFYVNVTDLNVDPFLLEPTIYEISCFQKPGIQYERITDLDKGIYLIGRARQVRTHQFSLQECSHLVRYFLLLIVVPSSILNDNIQLMQFNNQICAILWKNMKMTNQGEFVKELFIPLITIAVLLMVEDDDEGTGKLFMTLMVPVYIPSSLVGLCRQLLVEYVYEKSSKYRDLYRIMGMRLQNYRIAWFITYVVKSALIGSLLIFALIYKLGFIVEVVLCFVLFILAQISQTLLLSTFFSNSQLAGEFGSFFQTILSTFYFASMYQWDFLVFVCPQSIVSYYLMNKLSKLEDSSYQCLVALFIHFIVSYWLFNLIESHQEGGFNCQCRKRAKSSYVELVDPTETQRQYDEEGLAFISIEIVKLFKQYGDVLAVDNLNLKIYSQQILCILGQNGAGKTTTLNILTGLLQKTSGKILYFGKNFDKKRDEIQKLIGFCPQENLLYGELTVKESLQYQGMMRGVDQADAEISNWIEILQLKQFKDYKTSELSGGNKRKLQIALAMMGGSQIIFLDEPTASIDPDSRRQIWAILKEIKKINKTLILTTHFLDEAEELADRIAIMKSGQLKACGSPESIKKELEVGFTLKIDNIQSSDQYSQIKHFFPELECSSGSEIEYDNIKYLISQVQLFNIIDKLNQLNSLGVKIQLVQNTLEAAYLKLNKDHLEENQLVKEIAFPMQQTHDPNIKAFLQISALLLKKFYVLKRNFTVQLMIVVPIVMLLIAYYFGYQLLTTGDQKSFFVTLFISQSFSLNSSIFISTPILERELKIRQQLQQMGVSQGTYLFATFLGDYFVMLIMVLSIYMITGQIDDFEPNQAKLLSILGCFGLAIIAFSYCASFLFSSNQSAFKIFPVMNFLVCYFLPSMIQPQSQELSEYFGYLFPLYTLNQALQNHEDDYSTSFIAQTTVYLLLYIIIEKISVLHENRRDGIRSEMALSVNDVSHSYTRQVLKQVQVQLPKSKVLAILGPNGAGKTTLIQLITDCLQLKYGKIMYNPNTMISSCQQQEGLWEDLTAEEIVHLYAMIKGGTKYVWREVKQILRILNIKGKVVNMSGGQKRKAALAISLVGHSGIIVLDEPSNGLDPISRKNLQNMIKKHVELRGSSIILTTHDMEEAQYLSDTICFIINGQLPFPQETSQSLIEKYGSGILLTMKARNEDGLEQIKFAFPKHQREGLVLLVKLGNEYDVVNVLTILRTLHADNLISAFTIKQANLEQVFLRQCKRQYNDD